MTKRLNHKIQFVITYCDEDFAMKKKQAVLSLSISLLLLVLCFACAPVSQQEVTAAAPPMAAPEPQVAAPEEPAEQAVEIKLEEGQLPVRFQQPTYVLQESAKAAEFGLGADEEISIPVGADISSTTGPVALRDILKRLVVLKNMNISWASDVDQHALVDVDIRAEDDFFTAISNILRQQDYFYELQNNTVIVKYRETRKFHIAMPFMASTYTSNVGGDVLGASGAAGGMKGNIEIVSTDNKFDIWGNIQKNLDQILNIWEETITLGGAEEDGSAATASGYGGGSEDKSEKKVTTRRNVQGAKGYYSIDRPIGLITVTAPRPLIEKIADYLDNLKAELFRQISIEAKIIEVTLTDSSSKGIDWHSALGSRSLNFELFGSGAGTTTTGLTSTAGIIYPGANRILSGISIANPFTAVIDAIETQGDTRVLANPKLSILNGQPALINVGDSQKYIDSVTTTVNEGTVSTSVTTQTVMSGLGMAVLATILDDEEIVLSVTPVTSDLEEPITYRDFGSNTVGLPKVSIREINTTVRVKSGDMLVIGGLIDSTDSDTDKKVPLLGDIPFLNRLFSHEAKSETKKELVILLQATIM